MVLYVEDENVSSKNTRVEKKKNKLVFYEKLLYDENCVYMNERKAKVRKKNLLTFP